MAILVFDHAPSKGADLTVWLFSPEVNLGKAPSEARHFAAKLREIL